MGSRDSNEDVLLLKESPDALLARHSEEVEEVRRRVERIRCSIPKKDRVRRARAAEEAAERENEMKHRHSEERIELGIPGIPIEHGTEQEKSPEDDGVRGMTMQRCRTVKESKAARRRRKKAEQEAEAQRRVEAERAQMGPTPKHIESEAIDVQLKPKRLRIHPIPADGHCLYTAVAHQMKLTKLDSSVPASVEGLRNATADYLIAHKNELMPFIETVDGDEERFRAYCAALRNEAVWGGQVEVKVMAELLKATIEVYAAGMPIVQMGISDSAEKILRLSYHRYYYGLGEHYNSVVPQV